VIHKKPTLAQSALTTVNPSVARKTIRLKWRSRIAISNNYSRYAVIGRAVVMWLTVEKLTQISRFRTKHLFEDLDIQL